MLIFIRRIFLKAFIKSFRWTCILEMVKITILFIYVDIISSTGSNWYIVILIKNIETAQKIHIKNQEPMLVGWDNK